MNSKPISPSLSTLRWFGDFKLEEKRRKKRRVRKPKIRQTVETVFNTGVDNSKILLPPESEEEIDPHYMIISSQDHVITHPIIVANQPIIAANPPSTFVSFPNETSQWVFQLLRGQVTIETTFDLSGFDISTILFSITFAISGTLNDILINGNSQGFTTPSSEGDEIFYFLSRENTTYLQNINKINLDCSFDNPPYGIRMEISITAIPL